jgi:hypothetical protein
MSGIWSLLGKKKNREILGWLGGGRSRRRRCGASSPSRMTRPASAKDVFFEVRVQSFANRLAAVFCERKLPKRLTAETWN